MDIGSFIKYAIKAYYNFLRQLNPKITQDQICNCILANLEKHFSNGLQ